MDTIGLLIEKTDVVSGTSKAGKDWQKIGFVIKEENVKFPKELYFETLKADLIKEVSDTSTGTRIKVWFDARCNKWKDRWFTSLNAYRIEVVREESQSSAPQQPEPEPPEDDLPF